MTDVHFKSHTLDDNWFKNLEFKVRKFKLLQLHGKKSYHRFANMEQVHIFQH